VRRMCQDPLACLWLHRIDSHKKGRAAVHVISAANPVTFDGIIPRDGWTVHLLLEPVTRRFRLVMTIMSLCVWVRMMCMSLLVTGRAVVAVAPVVAGC
jgi:hypothetical protein